MVEDSVSTLIQRPVDEVFAAVADITRMGDYSPECIAARWKGGATGPAVGAEFGGDNFIAYFLPKEGVETGLPPAQSGSAQSVLPSRSLSQTTSTSRSGGRAMIASRGMAPMALTG